MLRIVLSVLFLFVLYPLVLGQLAGPSLAVTGPPEGATLLGTAVTVDLKTTNFEIVPSNVPLEEAGKQPEANKEGQGHVLLTLDSLPVVVLDQGDSYTFVNVPQGDHRLKVELVNNDHSALAPPVIRMVRFRSFIVPAERPSATAAVVSASATAVARPSPPAPTATATAAPTSPPPPTATAAPPDPSPRPATATRSPANMVAAAATTATSTPPAATPRPTSAAAVAATAAVSASPKATAAATAGTHATAITAQPTAAAPIHAKTTAVGTATAGAAPAGSTVLEGPNRMPVTAEPFDPATLLAIFLVLIFGVFVSGFVVKACSKLMSVTEDICLRLRSVYMAAATSTRVRSTDDCEALADMSIDQKGASQ